MNQKLKYVGIAAILPLLTITLAGSLIDDADAYKRSGVLEDTKDTLFFRGDLTAPAGDKPFGGDVVGDYFVQVNFDEVKIISKFETQGKSLEGWLVDTKTSNKLSLGVFDKANNELATQLIVDSWIYDIIIITEKPRGDDNSNTMSVGGSVLKEAPKHVSSYGF